jgi:hypothetical protein
MFSADFLCDDSCGHALIVSRWKKTETYEAAEQYICQSCFRLFDHQELAKIHCNKRDIEQAMVEQNV